MKALEKSMILSSKAAVKVLDFSAFEPDRTLFELNAGSST